MDVSNYVTYEGRLDCAREEVAVAKAFLPYTSSVLDQYKNSSSNAMDLLRTIDVNDPVLFFDTLKVACTCTRSYSSLCSSRGLSERFRVCLRHSMCPSRGTISASG